MKKQLFGIIVLVTAVTIASCSSNNGESEALQARVDSLSKVNQKQGEDLKNMSSFVTTISMSLDSIKLYEDSLLRTSSPEGPKMTKEQVKLNLEKLMKVLERQQQQLADLRKQLETAKGANAEEMKKLVDFYEEQLKAKDAQIANLRGELDKKNVDISRLRTNVSSLITSNKQLEEKTELQNNALSVQNEMLNTAYVQIGTKKELKAKGLLTGGFLKKTKMETSMLKETNFNKVDIRQFNDVKLQSKSPKILTQMPASSYTITKNSDGTCTLQIQDPASFWSVTNFLIIQL